MYKLSPKVVDRPIPDMGALRELRNQHRNYQGVKFDDQHPLWGEELVELSPLGLKGQSYYSRKFPEVGIDPKHYLRKDVALKLQTVNIMLKDERRARWIWEYFGNRVELYVVDSLRAPKLVKKIRSEYGPQIIRQQNASLTDKEVQQQADRLFARPKPNAPHTTGGAVDVSLRYSSNGKRVPIGLRHFQEPHTSWPDYYEHLECSAAQEQLRNNRRLFYWLMVSVPSDVSSSLVCNPEEIWHYGTGDPLSALIASRPAYYKNLSSA